MTYQLPPLLDAIQCCQDLTPEAAKEVLEEMVQRLLDGEDPEEILASEGLEPDWSIELIYLAQEAEGLFGE